MTEFEAVRLRLSDARRHGVPFDEAWRALGVVRGDSALAATRSGWERAYNLAEPTTAEAAVARLAGAELPFELVDGDRAPTDRRRLAKCRFCLESAALNNVIGLVEPRPH